MQFEQPLIPARLLRRYKRFLADVELYSGTDKASVVTVHCPNTGSMKHCVVEGSPCWLWDSGNSKRKYPLTLELVTATYGGLAGVNTGRANGLVREAIENGVITQLQGYSTLQAEKRYGEENSRIDFWLTDQSGRECFVEVKSVTLGEKRREGLFPDAVSVRGQKHLRELMSVSAAGHRAVLLFCVQHSGIDSVAPADEIDPVYSQLLREAAEAGVEVIAYRASLSASEITLDTPLPVVF